MATTTFSGPVVSENGFKTGTGGSEISYVKAYTVSVDPASIAAGVMAETTVTVTGVTTADTIVANPPTNLNADLEICAVYVSAADTVKIRLRNNHATNAVDETAKNWKFLAFRVATA